jgi:hypothetical protein
MQHGGRIGLKVGTGKKFYKKYLVQKNLQK